MRTVSLRRRVVALGVAVVALILVGLDVFVYLSLRQRLLDNLEDLLAERAALAQRLAPALTPEELVARLDGSGVSVTVRRPDGSAARSEFDDVGVPEGTSPPSPPPSKNEVARRLSLPDGEVVELSVSRAGVDQTLRRLVLPDVLGTAVGIAVAAVLLARAASLALRLSAARATSSPCVRRK